MIGILTFKGSLGRAWQVNLPWGRIIFTKDVGEGTPGPVISTKLSVEHRVNGKLVESRDLGSGTVTTAGVTLMAADWTSANAALKLSNYHDTGTGITAAAISDTVLQTPTGMSRVAGTQSNTNNIYNSTAIITYNGTYSITEWGLFTATSGGTLWDRRTFTAISVSNLSQLTWNYSLLIVPGG